jgi:hypothetical protein
MLHGEVNDFVTIAGQQVTRMKKDRLGAGVRIEELVDLENAHEIQLAAS